MEVFSTISFSARINIVDRYACLIHTVHESNGDHILGYSGI